MGFAFFLLTIITITTIITIKPKKAIAGNINIKIPPNGKNNPPESLSLDIANISASVGGVQEDLRFLDEVEPVELRFPELLLEPEVPELVLGVVAPDDEPVSR